jgi:putative salt-induced outer membrane protein YdiY
MTDLLGCITPTQPFHEFLSRRSPIMNLRSSTGFLATCLVALFTCLSAKSLHADTVVLKNGDRLTGTAIKLEAGKLIFKTTYADAINISWDEVTTLSTNQPMVLTTPKGALSITAVERSAEGMIVTTTSGPVTVEPSSVKVLRSPTDQKAYEDSLHPNWTHAWTGNVNVSLALAQGNSETATFNAGLVATRTTPTDKTLLYANTIYSENSNATPSTSAKSTTGGLRYDHNLNPRIFAFGTADFSTNELQNLDLRSILGGGFGWHPVKTSHQTLDILGGLVWTHESYSPTPTNSFAALDLGEQYTRMLGARSQFTEQAYFYPDLKNTGQYQLNVDSTINTKLGKIFSWQTTFSDRYTSFPPTGTLSNDVIVTTGLGIALMRP